MRKLVFAAVIMIVSTSCSKQNGTPTDMLNESADTSASVLVYTGSFLDGPFGAVMGQVNIYQAGSKYSLELRDFNTSNGPDLHVYLSEEVQPVHFIDLGKLKSTNGNQVYTIPAGTDFSRYGYALIHCQQYNHLFGSSKLE